MPAADVNPTPSSIYPFLPYAQTVSPYRFTGSVRDPDQAMAEIVRREGLRFDQMYAPVIHDAVASLNDTSIIDQAAERTGQGLRAASEQRGRTLSRYGLDTGGIAGAQFARDAGVRSALADVDNLNRARTAQAERNLGLRNALINIGRGFSATAQEGLSQAADAQSARERAGDAARAQHQAGLYQAAGTLGSVALLAAFL